MQPIHYQTAANTWDEIDNTLLTDSSLPGIYHNAANDFVMQVATDPLSARTQTGSSSTLHLADGQVELDIQPRNATLANGQVQGQTITYSDITPGVDLSYTTRNDGVHLAYQLDTLPTDPVTFTLQAHIRGATPTINAGNVEIAPDDGDTCIQVEPFVVPAQVVLAGAKEGLIEETYIFTATTSPLSITLPISYTWQASGQDVVTQTAGLSTTASFAWASAGTQAVTVTASNTISAAVVATHYITIKPKLVSLEQLRIAGPETGVIQTTYTFSATMQPASATLPITCTWEATDQPSDTARSNGLASSVSYTWQQSGTKTLTMTATNGGEPVTQNYQITIDNLPLYLPLVER